MTDNFPTFECLGITKARERLGDTRMKNSESDISSNILFLSEKCKRP